MSEATNAAAKKEMQDRIADECRRAEEAQKRRLATPPTTVGGAQPIWQKEWQRKFAPETVPQPDPKTGKLRPPELHGFWGNANLHDQYLSDGYAPRVGPDGGYLERFGTRLYTLDMRLYRQTLLATAKVNEARIPRKDRKEITENGVKTESYRLIKSAKEMTPDEQ